MVTKLTMGGVAPWPAWTRSALSERCLTAAATQTGAEEEREEEEKENSGSGSGPVHVREVWSGRGRVQVHVREVWSGVQFVDGDGAVAADGFSFAVGFAGFGDGEAGAEGDAGGEAGHSVGVAADGAGGDARLVGPSRVLLGLDGIKEDGFQIRDAVSRGLGWSFDCV